MTGSPIDPDGQAEQVDEPGSGPGDTAATRTIADVEADLANVTDRLMRALAEQENIRRRAARDAEDSRKQVSADFARDVLSAADNLRRALDSVPEDEAENDAVRRLLAGVVATERAMLEALEKHGISRIDPLGEPFDPHFHHAMFETEADDRPAGTVVQVLQPGYLSHGRLLRPASVAVARGRQRHSQGRESG